MKSQKIRNSARGEECTFNVVGICNYNPETTVLAHLQLKGHGIMAGKAHDLSSCYACSDCHDYLDRRNGRDKSPEQQYRNEYMLKAHINTIIRMQEKGIISV